MAPPSAPEHRVNLFDLEDLHGNGRDSGVEAQDNSKMPMESIKLPLAVHQICENVTKGSLAPASTSAAIADHPDDSKIEECTSPEQLNN